MRNAAVDIKIRCSRISDHFFFFDANFLQIFTLDTWTGSELLQNDLDEIEIARGESRDNQMSLGPIKV